ncbi:hypothetical protein NRL14_06165 [Pseudoalteromonas sp. 20-92]|uniref:hypothetical protein n=1 Tax=Pseudoalteromonas sp. 20-92 TaxID=2969394 RepID=UPI0027B06EFC|nr:hypothetical protein [Pseudoalteromonas sp. 20-92]MDQ2043313.1 hypothetical protein [Pseudoalteromonas sp. 20-92]
MPKSSLIAQWGAGEFTVIFSGTSITDAMTQANELNSMWAQISLVSSVQINPNKNESCCAKHTRADW